METVGSLLKQEREKQNKSLQEVAKATRISKQVLESIEEGRSEKLLPASYVRGFLRLYAQLLGLNPAEIIQMYNGQADDRGKWGPQKELKGPISTYAARPGTWIGFGIAIFLCMVLYFSINTDGPDSSRLVSVPQSSFETPPNSTVSESVESSLAEILEAVEPEPVPVPAAPPPPKPVEPPREPEPVASAAPADEPIAPVATSERFWVRFEAEEMIWARLSTDDGDPFEVLLRPGETYRKSADRVLKVRIGNPGGLSLFFNDTPVELTGDPDRPVDLVFPDDAIRRLSTQ